LASAAIACGDSATLLLASSCALGFEPGLEVLLGDVLLAPDVTCWPVRCETFGADAGGLVAGCGAVAVGVGDSAGVVVVVVTDGVVLVLVDGAGVVVVPVALGASPGGVVVVASAEAAPAANAVPGSVAPIPAARPLPASAERTARSARWRAALIGGMR
jgi:hypothetical protein